MNRTKIEWVRNPDGSQGFTWNPLTGCLNGCEYCYARKLANGRLKPLYLANKNTIPYHPAMTIRYQDDIALSSDDPFYPRFWLDRVREEFGACTSGAVPKGIFVCDMSDLFGIGVPEEWTRRILNKIGMSYYREHRFYLLTKQPQNLIKFSPFPDNCWVGVTATSTEKLLQACSYLEYPLEAKVKYLSIEPFLDWDFNWNQSYLINVLKRADIAQVIIGAQTKPYKPPKIEWVEEIVQACDKAGIPLFLKDNLKPLLTSGQLNGNDIIESHNLWAFKQFKLRQEMPVCQKPQ